MSQITQIIGCSLETLEANRQFAVHRTGWYDPRVYTVSESGLVSPKDESDKLFLGLLDELHNQIPNPNFSSDMLVVGVGAGIDMSYFMSQYHGEFYGTQLTIDEWDALKDISKKLAEKIVQYTGGIEQIAAMGDNKLNFGMISALRSISNMNYNGGNEFEYFLYSCSRVQQPDENLVFTVFMPEKEPLLRKSWKMTDEANIYRRFFKESEITQLAENLGYTVIGIKKYNHSSLQLKYFEMSQTENSGNDTDMLVICKRNCKTPAQIEYHAS